LQGFSALDGAHAAQRAAETLPANEAILARASNVAPAIAEQCVPLAEAAREALRAAATTA
jgi:hypothetical protein